METLAEGVYIYHGDCLELLQTVTQPLVVVSDPPYGISAKLGINSRNSQDGGMWAGVSIAGDLDLSVRDAALALVRAPFAVLGKVNTAPPAGTKITLCWDKGGATGAGDLSLPWKPNFELVFVGGRGWHGSRRSSILSFPAVSGCVGRRNTGHRFHPFEKPVELMQHLIERAPEGIIVDPFMGSGTTGIAAIRCRRSFIGIEVDKKFFDTARSRLTDELSKPSFFRQRIGK